MSLLSLLLLALQVEVMYKSYLDKLKSPQESTLPARELWMEIDRNTITMGSLVSHATSYRAISR